MNCRKIFDCAAALIAEDPHNDDIQDLLDRSVGILNTCIYNTYDINNMYEMRVLNRPEPQYCEIESIDDEFPLCDDMAGICIYYLASVLVNNENVELSDNFNGEYKSLLNDIIKKIPADVEKISDIYG